MSHPARSREAEAFDMLSVLLLSILTDAAPSAHDRTWSRSCQADLTAAGLRDSPIKSNFDVFDIKPGVVQKKKKKNLWVHFRKGNWTGIRRL